MKIEEKLAVAISQIEESSDFEIIAEMKAAMNSVYGEERNQIVKPSVKGVFDLWDQFNVSIEQQHLLEKQTQEELLRYLKANPQYSTYHAIIHFPEIIITNGSKSHKITNIFVKFFIRPDGKIHPFIYGMRSTLTEAEYKSLYLHSHLRTLASGKIYFKPFCTGVGEINQVLAVLNTNYTSANFMMFLMHIKNFLEWESKEGTPYITIDNIFKRGERSSSHHVLADWASEKIADALIVSIGKKLEVSEFMKMFPCTTQENYIVVKASLEAERWMASIIENSDLTYLTGDRWNIATLLCLRDSTGAYYTLPYDNIRIKHDGTILNFKGQEIKFQIIDKIETKKNETYTNPKITAEVCKKLSHLFTKIAITTPGIKSGSALIYNERASEPSNLPVLEDLDRRVVGNALL
jgi:hypothetical protein